jgi:hypothetical protein
MSIFAIGNGKVNGELGTGNFEEKLDPVMLETIKGKTVVELKACESNALAITGTSHHLSYMLHHTLFLLFYFALSIDCASFKVNFCYFSLTQFLSPLFFPSKTLVISSYGVEIVKELLEQVLLTNLQQCP